MSAQLSKLLKTSDRGTIYTVMVLTAILMLLITLIILVWFIFYNSKLIYRYQNVMSKSHLLWIRKSQKIIWKKTWPSIQKALFLMKKTRNLDSESDINRFIKVNKIWNILGQELHGSTEWSSKGQKCQILYHDQNYEFFK